MGRNLAFLARLVADGNVSVADGGCAYLAANDEATALLLDPATGLARIVSDNAGTKGFSVGFVCSLCAAPAVCAPRTPLTAGPFACERLDAYFDDTYDFYRWVGTGIKYTLNVAQGVLLGAPYGPDRA